MKTRVTLSLVAVWMVFYGASVWGYTEGDNNNFFGTGAGSSTTGYEDTFIGAYAGYHNTTGSFNSFLGYLTGFSNTTGGANSFLGQGAGHYNTTGNYNTFLGYGTGYLNNTGHFNTFLGQGAGYSIASGSGNVCLGSYAGFSETGSNKLYIANSITTSPLIYGDFGSSILRINGSFGVGVSPIYLGDFSGGGVSESQLHFSLNGTDTGGWITSVLDNNFYLSSGAAYDKSAGGWVQKSPDGMAVMAGSGATGYRVMMRTGCAVGTVCPPVTRLMIDYNGNVGLGVTPCYPLQLAWGAYSDGASWINGSSREYKDNIRELTKEEALSAFQGLNPVAFTFKTGGREQHVGFVAEDVPDLVATKDRKGLSPMDIVAVLTKVVQEQQAVIKALTEKLTQLEAKVEDLQSDGSLIRILSQK